MTEAFQHDFHIVDGGKVFLVIAKTPAAEKWAEENISEESLRFGNGVAVEDRFIENIVNGIQNAGMTMVYRKGA
jgi:hypothetical protein